MESRSEFEKLIDLKMVERLTRLNNNISELIRYVSQGDYENYYKTYTKIIENNDLKSVELSLTSMESLKKHLSFDFK